MSNLSLLRRLPYIFGTFVVLLAGWSEIYAATINVTANATDTLNGADSQCSLREAITNINNGAATYADCVNAGSAYGTNDTINIPAGTYTTTLAGSNEDLNATGDYDILKNVAIVGAGQASTIIDGNALDRVFHIVGSYTVSFSGVTIQNGAIAGDWGGGILNASNGTISVTNSTIRNNSVPAGGGGGGISMTTGSYSGNGTLTLTHSTITNNTAGGAGAGIYAQGSVSVSDSTISNNTVTGGSGGGLFTNSGELPPKNSLPRVT